MQKQEWKYFRRYFFGLNTRKGGDFMIKWLKKKGPSFI
ncbi:class C sortase, partial [Streptococcus suis]|nr:class C sortase [Streptococcus suis]